jgi:hypothetical protein
MSKRNRALLMSIATLSLALGTTATAEHVNTWCHNTTTSWPGHCPGGPHKMEEPKNAKVQVGTSKKVSPAQVPAGVLQNKNSALAAKPGVKVDPTNPNAEGMKESKNMKESDKGNAGFHWDSKASPGGATTVPAVQTPGLLDPVPHLNPGAGRAGPFPR